MTNTKYANIQRVRALRAYYSDPNRCLFCNTVIYVAHNQSVSYTRTKKFCNSRCAGKHSAGLRSSKRKVKICLCCEKKTLNKKFCSVECQIKYRKNKVNKQIENGERVDIRQKKRYLIEKHGHQCMICDTKRWMGQPVLLIIDHINGRANDHRLSNLRLVCANCDAQLPTYKSKNKNSTRTWRVGREKKD